MRRLLRILLNAATVLSLLLCVAGALLWARSRFAPGPLASFTSGGISYTLQSEQGRLLLFEPPAAPAAEVDAAWELLYEMRNDRLAWTINGNRDSLQGYQLLIAGLGGWLNQGWFRPTHGPAFSAAEKAALLRALSDADRFAAAHVVLVLAAKSPVAGVWERPAAGTLIWNLDGLRVRAVAKTGEVEEHLKEVEHLKQRRRHDELFDAVILPDQRAGLRNLWIARLSRPVTSILYWPFIIGFALLPIIRGRASWVMRRRRKAGLCPVCGYDLRATPDRCPECGMAR